MAVEMQTSRFTLFGQFPASDHDSLATRIRPHHPEFRRAGRQVNEATRLIIMLQLLHLFGRVEIRRL